MIGFWTYVPAPPTIPVARKKAAWKKDAQRHQRPFQHLGQQYLVIHAATTSFSALFMEIASYSSAGIVVTSSPNHLLEISANVPSADISFKAPSTFSFKASSPLRKPMT